MNYQHLIKKNKRFFDKVAKYYDYPIFRKWNNSINLKIIDILKIKKNSTILDAGCGTGLLLYFLLSLDKNLRLYGVDVSENMIKRANKKLKGKANIINISVEKINFKNKFDYIISVDAFHHYANHLKSINNFYYALKNFGILAIIDFDFGKIGNFIFHLIEPGNTKTYGRKDIYCMMKNSGFKSIKIKRIGLFSYVIYGMKLISPNNLNNK